LKGLAVSLSAGVVCGGKIGWLENAGKVVISKTCRSLFRQSELRQAHCEIDSCAPAPKMGCRAG
jgi:hypothetical protein